MFCMRLSTSGRGYHEAFGNQAIESFLEGHVHAFEHFGGVPAGMIRYDNLKDAVIKVLLGRARLENERFAWPCALARLANFEDRYTGRSCGMACGSPGRRITSGGGLARPVRSVEPDRGRPEWVLTFTQCEVSKMTTPC